MGSRFVGHTLGQSVLQELNQGPISGKASLNQLPCACHGLGRSTLQELWQGPVTELKTFSCCQHLSLHQLLAGLQQMGVICTAGAIAGDNQYDGDLLPAAGLVTSSEDYYPTVAINALMRNLRDPAMSSHHPQVIRSLFFIFQALHLGSVPYLPKVRLLLARERAKHLTGW